MWSFYPSLPIDPISPSPLFFVVYWFFHFLGWFSFFFFKESWQDVTTILREGAASLHLGEMICSDKFSLFEAMSAHEIMDPKMDMALLVEKVIDVCLALEQGWFHYWLLEKKGRKGKMFFPCFTFALFTKKVSQWVHFWGFVGSIPLELTGQQTLECLNQLLILESLLYDGHSMPQTIYTCLYVHRPILGMFFSFPLLFSFWFI